MDSLDGDNWLTTSMKIVFNNSFDHWYEVEGSGKRGEILNLSWCPGHGTIPVSKSDSGISQPQTNLTKLYLLRILTSLVHDLI